MHILSKEINKDDKILQRTFKKVGKMSVYMVSKCEWCMSGKVS